MMKLASRVIIFAVAASLFCLSAFGQNDGSRVTDKDPRNTAPTVGTGGPTGGPTGLFTVYDGKTLRKGEHTLSIAYSNFDRDPGNIDITEIPVSFQVALSNKFEVFYNVDIYRGVKVNSLRNISGPYLANGAGFFFPAIVLGTGQFAGQPVFRPANTQSPGGTLLLGGTAGNSNGSLFPGVGSAIGGILPGIVLQTVLTPNGTVPTVFTIAPSYNPDAPLINKRYGDSYFNTHVGGFKWRWTNPDGPVGVGIIGAYRYFADRGSNRIGELFDGASPGGSRGDFLGTFFLDARVGQHVNISANVGYNLNADIKAGGSTLLNRPDELLFSAGIDFPINRFFQPIVEVRNIQYVRSRTINAFENEPWEVLGGFRIFPQRWFGFSFAYRRHLNQQDSGRFDNSTFAGSAIVQCDTVSTGGNGCTPTTVSNSFTGVPPGFLLSENPHGYLAQFFIGRRNPRLVDIENKFANVTALSLSQSVINLPCGPGTGPRPGTTCNDGTSVRVSTTAVDPENDVLTYNYTVSGGRIVDSGANVTWDLSGLSEGTYTITAAVDDGCGLCGQTQTQTVTVAKCDCVPLCNCPSISVTAPAGVINPSQTATFTANYSGAVNVTYNWTVSDGTIESGQGTPSIVVRTSLADAGKTIEATVSLGGLSEALPNCGCETTARDSVPVAERLITELVDEFGKLPNDDIRGRLDNFFQVLSNNPNDQGYIINYGTPVQIAARERLITNHITFRSFDRSRITLIRGGDKGDGVSTKLYRVPPGADNPNP
ncbi:MAG: hypothetical protein ACRD6X_06720 [Pyrinomonadaceae bacterium]